MIDKEFYERHQEALRNARAIATRNVMGMALPETVKIPDRIIGLGKKISQLAEKIRREILKKNEKNLPKIMAVALHEYWFACCAGAAYVEQCIKNGDMRNTDYMKRMAD